MADGGDQNPDSCQGAKIQLTSPQSCIRKTAPLDLQGEPMKVLPQASP